MFRRPVHCTALYLSVVLGVLVVLHDDLALSTTFHLTLRRRRCGLGGREEGCHNTLHERKGKEEKITTKNDKKRQQTARKAGHGRKSNIEMA